MSWGDYFIGNIRVQLKVAKEVVAKLEATHDHRQLAEHKEVLRCEMKLKTLNLSLLQRTIARQESRAMWISEGRPTKFFHIQASARRHWNFIRSLEHEGHNLLTEDSKAAVIYDYFDSIMSTAPSRSCSIALDDLDLPHLKL
jgi:hypothetical protein